MEIQRKEALLETLRERMKEAEEKARTLKLSFENLGGIIKIILCLTFSSIVHSWFYFHLIYPRYELSEGEIEAFQKAEEELTQIEKEINNAEAVYLLFH